MRRELSKAFLHRNGICYLAPEIALLYKASDFENPAYQLDFDAVYPCLNVEQKNWFLRGIKRLYPDGHPWAKQNTASDDDPA